MVMSWLTIRDGPGSCHPQEFVQRKVSVNCLICLFIDVDDTFLFLTKLFQCCM